MPFSVTQMKTTELSKQQIERIIELAGLAFSGDYETSIRKDLNRDIEIIFVSKNEQIIGFHIFEFAEINVEGIRILGIMGSVLAAERKSAKGINILYLNAITAYLKEQQKRGCRGFALLPIAGYRMYRFLENIYRCYYPNPEYKIPPFEKQVLDALATHFFGRDYDPESGLISIQTDRYGVREDVEKYTSSELEIKSIGFFKSLNPNAAAGGYDLACLMEVSEENTLVSSLNGLVK